MKKYLNLLWITALVLGWLFDFLFWRRPVGINFAVFFTLCLLGGFGLLLANGHKPAPKSLWLLLPFAFFTTIAWVRREPLTLILAYAFTFVSLGLLAVTYLGGRWPRYGLFDYFYKFFQLAYSMILRPYQLIDQSHIDLAALGAKMKGSSAKRIIRGILFAIPVVIFFTVLLASADIVFNQKLSDFFAEFDIDKIPEYVFRLIIILFLAYNLVGVFLHAALHSQDEKLLGEERPVLKHFLHFTETAIILGSVVVLFLLFVIVQFRYFFGGEVNIGVEGYTYSQYARSGFNELIWVALCSLAMSLGLSTITRRETEWHKRIYSGLSVAVLALVLVILVSAYQRLSLAIDWHGFSRLRLYPRVFLIWVGILFVAVIVLEIIRREHLFAFAAVLAALGFAVTLSLIDIDASIVRHNVYRTLEGKHFNANHLTTLSEDAVPELVAGFNDPSLPLEVHEGIGAALACFTNSDFFLDFSTRDWRSFNISQWRAFSALDSVDELLQEYQFRYYHSQSQPPQVKTPGGTFYDCANYGP